MVRYQRTPILVDAWQWNPDKWKPDDFLGEVKRTSIGEYYVVNMEGEEKYLTRGDYLILEEDGDHYTVCSQKQFEDTHEKME